MAAIVGSTAATYNANNKATIQNLTRHAALIPRQVLRDAWGGE